jgi:hypothetical protein
LTAEKVIDSINEIYPKNVYKFVLELREDGDTWAGFGPTGEKSTYFPWLVEHWKK